MSHLEALSYKGKRVVMTGCATGMGAAAAEIVSELGGEIIGLDVKPIQGPVAKALECNLADRASIDAALDEIGDEPVHALFNCAGLPGPPFSAIETTLVNFVGHRHLTDHLVPRMPEGGAIASITTYVNLPLNAHDDVMALLSTPDFDTAKDWLERNLKIENGYSFSKECLLAYTLIKAKEFGEKYKVRINAVGPGPTETPLWDAFSNIVGGEDFLRNVVNGFLGRVAQPIDPAWPLVFLNSDAAGFISGQHLFADAGFNGAVAIGAHTPAALPRSVQERLERERG